MDWDIVVVAFLISVSPGVVLYFHGALVKGWGYGWLWNEVKDGLRERRERGE